MKLTLRQPLVAAGFLLLGLMSLATSAQAQAPAPAASTLLRGPAASPAREVTSLDVRTHSPVEGTSKRPPSYQLEGAIIGAVVLGGAALALGLALDDPDAGGSVNVPVATITGAAIGGLVGAIIGGSIPKGPPKGQADSSAVAP